MPQDTAFTLPFGAVTSPDADAARHRSLLWCRRQGLIADPVDELRFLRRDIAGLMAAWTPRASGEQLDLTVDAVVVATFLDDHVHGPLADQPDRVAAACTDFATVIGTGGRPPAGAGPLMGAFGDVWRRLADGASPAWLERTGQHWQWHLGARAQEAHNRARRRVPTRAEYAELRRRSGFVYAMIDLSQKAYGFELPRRLHTDSVVRRMLDITADVVDALDDVHSVEKKESRGDLHNLVLVIEDELGCDRADSLREIRGMISAWCEEFLSLEQRLPGAVGLRDTATALRIADCMRTAMSGYLEWSRTTRRSCHLVPTGEPAPAADPVTSPRPTRDHPHLWRGHAPS
ncbi:hypothetical protein AB0C76_29910 [Kitasatospora sp. NPDC048722]|uniref:terpene synthase family protein n=1 Tax=Kitasatospora sp. NPDC048722 TaxID=3155639 RepID=UPI0033F37028